MGASRRGRSRSIPKFRVIDRRVADTTIQIEGARSHNLRDVNCTIPLGALTVVTGVSGSGPAYVFHMIEALAAAGEAEGLTPALAMQLARATVAGAGALAMESGESAEQLRINVTSPNGTTQAGLEVLMSDEAGLGELMGRTVAAAAARSREWGS